MISRQLLPLVQTALGRQAVVALLGPRQVGKTTLAWAVADQRPAVYLDLESAEDRAKLSDPLRFFRNNSEVLIILDEIHRMPELFQTLRGVVDESRRQGKRFGRFLILGSASIALLQQSGESLAGRIEYLNLTPLNVLETAGAPGFSQDQLWLRGGFPDSYSAASDDDSFVSRRNFIRTYLERDVAQFGPRIAATTLERLWTMLAHNQGQLLNASRLAGSLGVSSPTVSSYIDLLCDLLLVRRLAPCLANTQKRLVKSPRVYIRDSGLTHALLGIATQNQLLGHPVAGASWEGFVIENILSVLPESAECSFYRTAAGAEIDLIINLPSQQRWAIEIKHSLAPKLSKGFFLALEDLQPMKSFVVYPGSARFPMHAGVEALGLQDLMVELRTPAFSSSGLNAANQE